MLSVAVLDVSWLALQIGASRETNDNKGTQMNAAIPTLLWKTVKQSCIRCCHKHMNWTASHGMDSCAGDLCHAFYCSGTGPYWHMHSHISPGLERQKWRFQSNYFSSKCPASCNLHISALLRKAVAVIVQCSATSTGQFSFQNACKWFPFIYVQTAAASFIRCTGPIGADETRKGEFYSCARKGWHMRVDDFKKMWKGNTDVVPGIYVDQRNYALRPDMSRGTVFVFTCRLCYM